MKSIWGKAVVGRSDWSRRESVRVRSDRCISGSRREDSYGEKGKLVKQRGR
jgi:hypothetical protein